MWVGLCVFCTAMYIYMHHQRSTRLVEEHQVHHGVPLVVLGQLGLQHRLELPHAGDGEVGTPTATTAAAICRIIYMYVYVCVYSVSCVYTYTSITTPPAAAGGGGGARGRCQRRARRGGGGGGGDEAREDERRVEHLIVCLFGLGV